MNKLALASAVAIALSSIAAAPAAAQEAQVSIQYGDLDLSTAAGSQTLAGRVQAGVKQACDRPDIRNLKSMAAWQDCRDSAMSQAIEQMTRAGATVTLVPAA